MPQQELFAREVGLNKRDRVAILGNLAEVLSALSKNSKTTALVRADIKENAELVESIQHLQDTTQEITSDLSERFIDLFGKNDTIFSLKNSRIGKFFSEEIKNLISDELKKQFKSLNVEELGGGRGLSGMGSLLGAGGTAGKIGKNLGKLLSFAARGVVSNPYVAGGLAVAGGAAYLSHKAGEAMQRMDTDSQEYYARISDEGSWISWEDFQREKAYSRKTEYADLASFKDRGSRNINPGNVKGSDYLGQVGKDEKGHAIFATKEAGVAGIVDRLYRYNKDKEAGDNLSGKKTIREIMYTYAPPSDNNNTEAYIASISRNLGISPDQQIDFKKNPELLKPFVKMIMKNESPGAKAYSETEIDKGIEIGRDTALLGKEASRQKHQSFLTAKTSSSSYASADTGGNLSGDLNSKLFSVTKSAEGNIRYGYGSKNINSGSIDCSGWVQTALKKAGAPADVVEKVVGKNAASQVIDTGKSTGTLKTTDDITQSSMKEGQLIGVRNREGRQGGIGHVGIVVRNPETGELGVSHSSSSKGVVWQPLATFQRNFGKHGFYTSDPLVASREIKKEEKAVETNQREMQKQNTMLASNSSASSSEVTSALTGTSASLPSTNSSTGSIASATEPSSSSNAARAIAETNTSSYSKNSLASTDRYSPTLVASLSPKTEKQEHLLTGERKPAQNTPKKTVVSKPKEQPIREVASTEKSTVVQPIIIPQKQQPNNNQKETMTAGASLPTRVDSPAVLAFQLDPTTPIHA